MTLKHANFLCCLFLLCLWQLTSPNLGFGKIYIDVTNPSNQQLKIAIPDFKNFSPNKDNPALSQSLPEVLSNDLILSGYFNPLDKEAFLDEDGPLLDASNIRFRNWSIIGSEFLLKGGYTCIGRSVELEIRLYDIIWGRQILAKRLLGRANRHRTLMHRASNEIISALTGHKGMFLSKIAFISTETGNKEIYMCDLDGFNKIRLTNDKSIAMLPKWSPFGDRILFTSFKDGGPMLYMKNIFSGRVSRISSRKGLNTAGCWSKDGESLALTLSHKGNSDIYLINLKGKILKRYTKHWSIDISPSFSPDEKKMAFVSSRSGNPQIYIKNLGQNNQQRLTFNNGAKYNTSPSWSSKNSIAFTQLKGGRIDIFTINSDGSNLRRLTADQGNNEDPCWSPDGRYIVFSSNRTGRYHIYIMNGNGDNQQMITRLKGNQTAPSWSHF